MSAAAHAFTWLNKQGVRSTAGFEVQCIDRFTIEYREGAKKVSVPVEDGLNQGRAVVLIGPDAFSKWDPPFDALNISSDKQLEMLQNFTAEMEFQGLVVLVD